MPNLQKAYTNELEKYNQSKKQAKCRHKRYCLEKNTDGQRIEYYFSTKRLDDTLFYQ